MCYMYILCCLKCLSFNLDSRLRVKLVCQNHRNKEHLNKYSDVCPCLYGIDEETIDQLIDQSLTRSQIIQIELKKWFELSENKEKYNIKEERRDEVYTYLKKLPYEERIWEDISTCWKVTIDPDG